MKNKKKNVFIILLLIIVVLPILLSFVKCDNGNSEMDPSTTIQEELKSVKRLNKARAYIGTAVPNTGICPDIYVNTNLSNNEVIEILDTIIYNDFEDVQVYCVFLSEYAVGSATYSIYLSIIKVSNEYAITLINSGSESISQEVIFSTSSDMFGFDGWNPTFNGSFLLSQLNLELKSFDQNGLPVGDQNNELSNLFSITPFVRDNRTSLQILFEEIGSGLSGLATFFVSLFDSIVPVFWVNNQPTIITILVLAGVVLTIGFWGIDKLLKLFKIGLGGKK